LIENHSQHKACQTQPMFHGGTPQLDNRAFSMMQYQLADYESSSKEREL
jgi:hypothetical protein